MDRLLATKTECVPLGFPQINGDIFNDAAKSTIAADSTYEGMQRPHLTDLFSFTMPCYANIYSDKGFIWFSLKIREGFPSKMRYPPLK